MDKVIIAIDPGAVGGIVIYGGPCGETICAPMPETETDVVDVIRRAYKISKESNIDIVCIIEKVGGFAGGDGQPGSAMFNFGFGAGLIYGALLAFKIRVEEVTPQKWQKGLSLGNRQHAKCLIPKPKKGASAHEIDNYNAEKKRVSAMNARYKTEWKNKLKAEAQRLYPNIKVTLKTSDALLILEYYKRFLNK